MPLRGEYFKEKKLAFGGPAGGLSFRKFDKQVRWQQGLQYPTVSAVVRLSIKLIIWVETVSIISKDVGQFDGFALLLFLQAAWLFVVINALESLFFTPLNPSCDGVMHLRVFRAERGVNPPMQ